MSYYKWTPPQEDTTKLRRAAEELVNKHEAEWAKTNAILNKLTTMVMEACKGADPIPGLLDEVERLNEQRDDEHLVMCNLHTEFWATADALDSANRNEAVHEAVRMEGICNTSSAEAND